MPCTERTLHFLTTQSRQRTMRGLLIAVPAAILAACAGSPPEPPFPASQPSGSASKVTPTAPPSPVTVSLPPPPTPRSWSDARLQAARRLVAANPDRVYTGKPPDILLAIPVMTVALHADGSIRHIEVMRYPSQARDTVDLAIQAIRRAAPFGDVSKLPKPWTFNETFLFNEERKFKPMTLDQR